MIAISSWMLLLLANAIKIPQKRSRHGHATSIYLPNMTLHMKLPKTTIHAHPPLGSLDSSVFDFGISSSIFRLLSVFEVWDGGII